MLNVNGKITSATAGRMRIKTPLLKSVDTERFSKCLCNLKGIQDLKVNTVTGSALVKYDPEQMEEEKFSKVFNKCLVKAHEPLEEAKEQAKKDTSVIQVDLAKVGKKVYRKTRMVENQTMAIAGGLCLFGVCAKMWKLHAYTGWAFAAAAIAHTIRYRRTVFK